MSSGCSTRLLFYTDISHVMYINAIIDSYDSLGLTRTLNKEKGLMCLYTTDQNIDLLKGLLDALSQEGIYISIAGIDYREDPDDQQGY